MDQLLLFLQLLSNHFLYLLEDYHSEYYWAICLVPLLITLLEAIKKGERQHDKRANYYNFYGHYHNHFYFSSGIDQ